MDRRWLWIGLIVAVGVGAMLYVRRASAQGLDYIRRFEDFSPVPYNDVAGKPTIGYGHLIQSGERFTSITKAQAEQLFRADVAKAEAAINELVKVPLSQGMFDALTSLVFNIGRGNFAGSTLLKKLNAGDIKGAADEFPRWSMATVNGQKRQVAGLLARRETEQETFLA